jgi:hypothetical protein
MSREQIHDHQSQMTSSIYRFDVSHRTGVKRGQFRTKKCSLRTGSSGLERHGKDVASACTVRGSDGRCRFSLACHGFVRHLSIRSLAMRNVGTSPRDYGSSVFPMGDVRGQELCESYVGARIAGATAFRIPCKSTIMWAIHFDGRTSPAPGTAASLFCRVERDVRRLVQRLGISCVLRAPCYTDACPDL